MAHRGTFRAALLGFAVAFPAAAFAQPATAPVPSNPNADWHRPVDDVLGNALENNVRLYRVVDGRRIQFAGVDAQVPRDRW
jgi:hypothetical protein